MGRFAGAIAHDFNNILSAILGSTDLLERKVGSQHPLITEIRQASNRASNLAVQVMRLAGNAPERTPSKADGEGSGSIDPGAGTVLVVLKQHSIRLLASQFLLACGYEILEAGGPDAAAEIVESHGGAIDAAVVDMEMPSGSGPELVRRLAETGDTLPAVYLAESGYEAASDSPHLVLVKPINPKELTDALARLLEGAPGSST